MTQIWQIPRLALLWMILAYLSVVALHFSHLPAWISVAAAITILWRVQLYRGVWSLPGRAVKWLIALICVIGLYGAYGRLIGLEPMVALLTTAFTLKLLEMQHQRDAKLVIYLAYFLASLQGLFNQVIVDAFAIGGCFLVISAALVALHQNSDRQSVQRPLKTAALLLLQAIPLMILMFAVMPRIGSLWTIPIKSHSARTGVSDTMSPGEFSNLGRLADVAFRVSFDAEAPPRHQLYWRGLVLSRFNGRSWHSAGDHGFGSVARNLQSYNKPRPEWDQVIARDGKPLTYNVIMEPSQQNWLYGLATAQPDSPGIAFKRDFTLVAPNPIIAKTRYRLQSWLNYRHSPASLPPQRRAIELSLPPGYNPRAVSLGKRWLRETQEPKAIIRRALSLYNQQFSYTLKPPRLGRHSVDEFLFDSKRGFCEHFASSFVVLMRAAGIPARVVVGYQGGERHPDNNYWLIRQYDAHAWAEVWLQGQGWVRVDPTAAVAPERIEFGLEDILGEEDDFLADSPFSLMNYRHIGWMNALRLRLDALNYGWARWVLGYDSEQKQLLAALLGSASPTRIGLFLLLTAGAILTILAALQLRKTRLKPRDQLDKLFLRWCRKLKKYGIERQVGEGARSLGQRIAREAPDIGRKAVMIAESYERMRYRAGQTDERALRRLKQQIREFR